MKRTQSGVSLSGLLVAAVILAVLAMVGMKVFPNMVEYFNIVKAVKKIANDPAAQDSVTAVRRAFENQSAIDDFKSITGQDLEISKEGGKLVVSFAYEARIPLVANVSLLIDFQGSSAE